MSESGPTSSSTLTTIRPMVKHLNNADLMTLIADCHGQMNKNGYHPGRSGDESPSRKPRATSHPSN